MSEDFTIFEKQIINLVETTLSKYRVALKKLALKPRICELEKIGAGATYTSEATICFDDLKKIDHGCADLADVIEFFVIKHGKPIASIEEITSWLEAAVADVLKRRKYKLKY